MSALAVLLLPSDARLINGTGFDRWTQRADGDSGKFAVVSVYKPGIYYVMVKGKIIRRIVVK